VLVAFTSPVGCDCAGATSGATGAGAGGDGGAGSACLGGSDAAGEGATGSASATPDVKLSTSSNDQDPGTRMTATIARDLGTRNWHAARPRARSRVLENPQFAGIYGRFTFVPQPSHKR